MIRRDRTPSAAAPAQRRDRTCHRGWIERDCPREHRAEGNATAQRGDARREDKLAAVLDLGSFEADAPSPMRAIPIRTSAEMAYNPSIG
jgi:hypothetical protein